MEINSITPLKGANDISASINKVQQRIKAIQDKFNIKIAGSEDFAQIYDKKIAADNQISNTQSLFTMKNGTDKNQTVDNSGSSSARSTDEISKYITDAAQKYGVDAKLLSAVAETESGYNQDAVSGAGAVGVMQLMPNTAEGLGVTDIHDAKQNIEGGAKYLKQLLNDFNGNVRKAVAAYNAGPQAVKKYNDVPPYAETQNYVSHVLDLYK